MHRILAVFAAIAALPACTADQAPRAQAAAASGRQCFNASTVNDFHALDRSKVIVTVGVNHKYLLDILETCPQVDWTLGIGLRATSGSNWVCQGQDAELLVPGPTGVDRCPVLGVRQLSLDEAKTLRAKYK